MENKLPQDIEKKIANQKPPAIDIDNLTLKEVDEVVEESQKFKAKTGYQRAEEAERLLLTVLREDLNYWKHKACQLEVDKHNSVATISELRQEVIQFKQVSKDVKFIERLQVGLSAFGGLLLAIAPLIIGRSELLYPLLYALGILITIISILLFFIPAKLWKPLDEIDK